MRHVGEAGVSPSGSSILSFPSWGVVKMLHWTFLSRWDKAFDLPVLIETSRSVVVLLALTSFRHSTRG